VLTDSGFRGRRPSRLALAGKQSEGMEDGGRVAVDAAGEVGGVKEAAEGEEQVQIRATSSRERCSWLARAATPGSSGTGSRNRPAQLASARSRLTSPELSNDAKTAAHDSRRGSGGGERIGATHVLLTGHSWPAQASRAWKVGGPIRPSPPTAEQPSAIERSCGDYFRTSGGAGVWFHP
jgi:hypothetical protein